MTNFCKEWAWLEQELAEENRTDTGQVQQKKQNSNAYIPKRQKSSSRSSNSNNRKNYSFSF